MPRFAWFFGIFSSAGPAGAAVARLRAGVRVRADADPLIPLLNEESPSMYLLLGPIRCHSDLSQWSLLPKAPDDLLTVWVIREPLASRTHKNKRWTRGSATTGMVDVNYHAVSALLAPRRSRQSRKQLATT